MDVRAAIEKAKTYVTDIFGPEGAYNVGLEEVEFDERDNIWNVTIGFSRPWDRKGGSVLVPLSDSRTYKIVEIDNIHEEVTRVKNRIMSTGTSH